MAATRQTKKVTKRAAPAARKTPARRAAAKPKTAAAKPRAATVAAKPASMTGPLPPIVTLNHLAEWTGYNHGVPKKQAAAMLRRGHRPRLEEGQQDPHSQSRHPASARSSRTSGAQGAQPRDG